MPASARSAGAFPLVLATACSALGTSLVGFGLDVQLFLHTGSYAMFATIAVLSSLAGIVFAPFAGMLADRLAKSRALVLCEAVALLATALAFLAGRASMLGPVVIGVLCVVLALCQTLRLPTLGAAISMIAPPAELTRLNGIAEVCQGAVSLSGALFAAVLLEAVGLDALLLLSACTYLLSIAVVHGVRHPGFRRANAATRDSGDLRSDVTFGARWILRAPVVRRLLFFFAVTNFGFGIFTVACTPLILAKFGAHGLAVFLSANAFGMLAGGALLGKCAARLPLEKIIPYGVLSSSVCMTLAGVAQTLAQMAALGFLFWIGVSMASGAAQTVWQTTVPAEIQGRVFAVRKMVAWSLYPFSLLLSIPLSHWLYAVVEQAGAPAARLLRAVWGAAPTGSLGVLIFCFGTLVVANSLVFHARGGLRGATTVPSHRPES